MHFVYEKCHTLNRIGCTLIADVRIRVRYDSLLLLILIENVVAISSATLPAPLHSGLN
jgi:hypothetical protein